MRNKFLNSALISVFLFTATSCSAIDRSNHPTEKSEEKTSEIDGKKLAKEAGAMVAWDVVLAGVCKAGLHFSVGVCLAADVLGDTGIILYSNLEPEMSKEVEKKKVNPLEFLMGVALMAITLVLI